jgi:hypothetical protein
MISVSPSGLSRLQRKTWESNPNDHSEGSRGLADRPGKPYPAIFREFKQWTHRESNPDYRHAMAVSSRWTMSPSISSGPHGSRTHHTDLARVSRPRRHAGPFIAEVRPGVEPGLRPYHGRVPPKTLTDRSHRGRNRTGNLLVVTQTSWPLDYAMISDRGGSRTCKRSGLSRAALPLAYLGVIAVVPDGVEPSFPGCEPSVVAVGPRDCMSGLTGSCTRIFSVRS